MQRIFLLQSFRCNKSRITIIAKLYLAQQVSKNLPIIIYEINYDSTILCSSMDFVRKKNRISGQSPSSIIPMAYKCTRKTYAQTHVIITSREIQTRAVPDYTDSTCYTFFDRPAQWRYTRRWNNSPGEGG